MDKWIIMMVNNTTFWRSFFKILEHYFGRLWYCDETIGNCDKVVGYFYVTVLYCDGTIGHCDRTVKSCDGTIGNSNWTLGDGHGTERYYIGTVVLVVP